MQKNKKQKKSKKITFFQNILIHTTINNQNMHHIVSTKKKISVFYVFLSLLNCVYHRAPHSVPNGVYTRKPANFARQASAQNQKKAILVILFYLFMVICDQYYDVLMWYPGWYVLYIFVLYSNKGTLLANPVLCIIFWWQLWLYHSWNCN